MDKELTIERKIELENWLVANEQIDFVTTESIMSLHEQFDLVEFRYLYMAAKMPLVEVTADLATLQPDASFRALINKMNDKYSMPINDLVWRISDVRQINYYLSLKPKEEAEEQVYQKLVRDNIDGIIENNGEMPITRILTDEEYWQALLAKDAEELKEVAAAQTKEEITEELADKLTVLKAMAEYHGLNLNDLIQREIVKTMDKGGFKRKLFLEKVITKK